MDLKDPVSGLDFSNPRHLAFCVIMLAIPLTIIFVRWYRRRRATRAALEDLWCRKHNFTRDLEKFVRSAMSLAGSPNLTAEKFQLLTWVCSEAASTAEGFAVRSGAFDPSLRDGQHELDFRYLSDRSKELYQTTRELDAGQARNTDGGARERVLEQLKLHTAKLIDLAHEIELGHGYLQGLQRGYPAYPFASIQQDLADAEIMLEDAKRMLTSSETCRDQRRLGWLADDIKRNIHRITDLVALPKLAFSYAESDKTWAELRLTNFASCSKELSSLINVLGTTSLVDLKALHAYALALHTEALAASKAPGIRDWHEIKVRAELALNLVTLGSRLFRLTAQE